MKLVVEKVIQNPVFKMCDCGNEPPHGYIHDDDDNVVGTPIVCGCCARYQIQTLFKQGRIKKEGRDQLFAQVKEAGLL
jgi:hypothetical protein